MHIEYQDAVPVLACVSSALLFPRLPFLTIAPLLSCGAAMILTTRFRRVWQVYPVCVSMLVLAFHSPSLPLSWLECLGVFGGTAISTISMLLFPLTLPTPTGPYRVGSRTVHMHDNSAGGDCECLVLYPSVGRGEHLSTNLRRTPYLPHEDAGPAYAAFTDIPSYIRWLFSHLHLITMPVFEHAPLTTKTEKLPVIVYCHGLGGTRSVNSILCTELASQGFVVFCPEYTDGSSSLAVTGSRTLIYDRPTPQLRADAPALRNFRTKQLTHRRDETMFVIDRLSQLATNDAEFNNRLLLDKVDIAGHSFGGATALVVACAIPEKLHRVLLFDPWTYPIPNEMTPADAFSKLKMLVVDSDRFAALEKRPLLEQLFAQNPSSERRWLSLTASGHQSFTDFPILVTFLRFSQMCGSDPLHDLRLLGRLSTKYLQSGESVDHERITFVKCNE